MIVERGNPLTLDSCMGCGAGSDPLLSQREREAVALERIRFGSSETGERMRLPGSVGERFPALVLCEACRRQLRDAMHDSLR